MKRYATLYLMLAFASFAKGQTRWPLRLPYHLSLSVVGSVDYYHWYLDSTTHFLWTTQDDGAKLDTAFSVTIVLDTTDTTARLAWNGDSLQYLSGSSGNESSGVPFSEGRDLTIVFDRVPNHIRRLSFLYEYYHPPPFGDWGESLTLHDLWTDSNTIYATDSLLQNHLGQAAYYKNAAYTRGDYNAYMLENTTSVTISSSTGSTTLRDGSLVIPIPDRTSSSIRCFPNPVTNSTTIRFTAQEPGYATVSIVNPLGVEVARVFAGEVGAGEHSLSWNIPAGLPAGMYECVVRMGSAVERVGIVTE